MFLKIIRAKSNPTGKDTAPLDVPTEQLAGEWVDIQNEGSESISLSNLVLYHREYPTHNGNTKWGKVMDLFGTLEPGSILRIHSGGQVELSRLRPEDRDGADLHYSTGKWYVWNNDEEDTAGLWDKDEEIWLDRVYYDASPPEGVILHRFNNKLIP